MRNYSVFVKPAWLLTISRQYEMRYYPVFINPAWLGTISRQYIFGLRHWNHALINHWIILCLGCYPLWLLTLSHQGICCLNFV